MPVILAKNNAPDTIEMRAAYAKAMTRMMDNGEPVLAMDADLMRAIGLLPYRDQYPEHIIDCGIAEQNMFAVAAGLSAEGFVPFPHSFGVFSSRRSVDQIFMSGAYAKLNVKVIGSDPGILAALNGGTHQAMEDIAIMRAIPEITIIEPTDVVMAEALTYTAAHTYGMFYIRLNRLLANRIYEEGSTFEIGKAIELRRGDDAAIFAIGIEVYEALQAADMLAEKGIRVSVYDMFSIKPLDRNCVVQAAARCGAVVTAENHATIGGLGSAVAEALADECPVPMERIGIQDSFGEVGMVDYLKKRFRLTADDIARAVEKAISRKKDI